MPVVTPLTPLLLLSASLLTALISPHAPAQEKSIPVSPSDPQTYALHPKPADHLLGDVHPFFPSTEKGGDCFLYYLKPGGYHSALLRSSDLLTWTEQPLTHDPAHPGDWLSPYFVLGVFRDPLVPAIQPPLYRSFFGHKDGRMASSTSTDLRHWSSAPKDFSIPPADYYQRRRDPFVFWIPETRQFGCVMTTWMKGRPKETCGAVSLATSPDLKTWQDHGPILDPGTIGEPECPQMFQLPGSNRWYLLASIYDRAVGQPVYWTANSPLGPWPKAPAIALDGKDLCAAQVAFDGDTPILFGWIPHKPARPGKQTWGGHLALPREIYALSDGTLATRLSARVVRTLDRLPWRSLPGFSLTSQRQPLGGTWPQNLALEFALHMPESTQKVDLHVANFATVHFQHNQLCILDAAGASWAELPLSTPLPSDQPITVRLIIDHDIIELFVCDRHTLAARLPPAQTGPLTLSFQSHFTPSQTQVSALRASPLSFAR